MKTPIKALFLAILLCQLTMSVAQESPPVTYHVIDYMKVAPGMQEDYLKLEKAWKKIHAAKKKAGMLDGWALSVVLSPAGADCEYNYTTRNTFRGREKLAQFYEGDYMPENWASLLTEEEVALVNRTGEIRAIVKEEVWSTIDDTMSDDFSDATIHVFNYFDFPEGKSRADHVKVETEIWKPVHAARVKDGRMKGWVLLQMEFPFGAAMPYHDATVDIYKDMNQLMTPFFEEYFGKVHAGKDTAKLLEQTGSAATLVKGELRMRIDRLE